MLPNCKVVSNLSGETIGTAVPDVVTDMDLDVYAFRLYVHVLKEAGLGGCISVSTRDLAGFCGMSIGKVVGAKRELAEADLIVVESQGRTEPDEILVCNIAVLTESGVQQ